jgi:hypothetical protein
MRIRWAAYIAAVFSLEYAVGKVVMAARGELGVPGHPAPPEAVARFAGDITTAQLGNAALGLLSVAVALAFAQRWGRRVPRPLLAAGGLVALLSGLAGAVTVAASLIGLREDHGQWGVDSLVLGVPPVAAWGVLVLGALRGVRWGALRALVRPGRRAALRTDARPCRVRDRERPDRRRGVRRGLGHHAVVAGLRPLGRGMGVSRIARLRAGR